MLRGNDSFENGAPQKKAVALKKELHRKSNCGVNVVTLKKFEEAASPKIKLS